VKLFDVMTQSEFEAVVLELSDGDFEEVRKSAQFKFDWNTERTYRVYKIVRTTSVNEQGILGLISLFDIPEEFRIHINLLEVSERNKGKNKEVDRIAGCLLAYAVRIAFEKGYSGFTSLVPKTELIPLYVQKYGFIQYGRQLAIEGSSAINLIQKYL
jgi:hypothetical protein